MKNGLRLSVISTLRGGEFHHAKALVSRFWIDSPQIYRRPLLTLIPPEKFANFKVTTSSSPTTHMTLPPALKKSMPALGKFGLWLGVSAIANHLTNSPELAEALTTAGVGVASLDGACEVIKGIASGKLSDYYKEFRSNQNFSANDNLQLALREGIANALSDLEITFSAEKKLPQDEKQQVSFFFRSLAHHLSKEINSDSRITDYVLDRAGFFRELLKEVHTLPADEQETNATDTGVLTPDLSDATAERLVIFLVDHIEPVAHRYINEEFKTNDKAKTAYFIHLLEYGARLNQANHDLLLQVSQSLHDIGQKQQEHTDLLRQVAQAQQKIYDWPRTLTLDFRAFVGEFDTFKNRINSQLEPSLRLTHNYEHLTDSFRYQYVQQYTKFIGRDAEIDQLWDFLNGQPTRRMLWWLVTGPGGMGKSCLEARCVNRYVGFVETDQLLSFDWSQWIPAAPTLLVVDYVAAYAEQTRKMIVKLSRNAQNGRLPRPVRVLLLERETRDDWWPSFLADRDVVESSYVSGKPEQVLALKPFSDDDRWQIVTDVHRKQQKPIPLSQAETLRSLAGIDPDGRPLFAFLAGMAMAENRDIRHWDVHDLLNNLLQREEREIWAKHPNWLDARCREGHKNLLVLTTLTRGLTVLQLKTLLSKSLPWLPDREPDAGLYKRLSDIRERQLPNGITEKSYEGLQPDIVGEYYVLKRIEELLTDDFTGEETVQALFQVAWDTAPREAWWSTWRTLNDFAHFPNPIPRRYIEASRPSPGASETAWLYWSMLHFNLTTAYGSKGDMASAESRHADLQKLAKVYPHNEKIAFNQAKGATNLIARHGDKGGMDLAETRYMDLEKLAKAYPHNEEIVLCQAMGAYNLTTDHSKRGNIARAEAYYVDLQKLTGAYPHNNEIVHQQAEGAYNLTNSYGRQGDMINAEARYTDLRKLAGTYPHNQRLVLQQAMGATNLIDTYGERRDIVNAESRYADLQKLAEAYPYNEAV